jgi:2-polyprenyl-3-methyl-5-hydroxy-6-metoxy-1,4-benzoquinol methylase
VAFACTDIIGADLGRHDAVVSLDVIEHVPADVESAFVEAIWRHVDPEGFCVVGTPNISAAAYASRASQIGHVNLFSPERLAATIRRYFVNAFVFGLNDEVMHTGYYPMTHYVMVVGSVPRPKPSA